MFAIINSHQSAQEDVKEVPTHDFSSSSAGRRPEQKEKYRVGVHFNNNNKYYVLQQTAVFSRDHHLRREERLRVYFAEVLPHSNE